VVFLSVPVHPSIHLSALSPFGSLSTLSCGCAGNPSVCLSVHPSVHLSGLSPFLLFDSLSTFSCGYAGHLLVCFRLPVQQCVSLSACAMMLLSVCFVWLSSHPPVHLEHMQVFTEGELILREGEVSREMYFLLRGTAQVEVAGQAVVALQCGSYFGEIGLFQSTKRSSSVRALTNCEAFALSKVRPICLAPFRTAFCMCIVSKR
jgi:Cyclic nucleotide-binding domain